MELEIHTDTVVSEENIKTATNFGVDSSELTDAKKYIFAFMKRLLLQKEKIHSNLLEAHLNPEIARMWKEVLSTLENTNRKLVNIQSGSLIFTLFCRTENALLQLKDERWRRVLQEKIDNLLKTLGMYRIRVILNLFKLTARLAS